MKNLFLAFAVLIVLTPALNAQCVDCPDCGNKVAVGFLKKTSDKKTVYEVSDKEIAVPNICLPRPLFNLKAQVCKLFKRKCCPGQPCGGCEFEDCPRHVRGGQIRVVKVMKKTSVKCDACSYTWEVTDVEKVNDYLYETKAENKNSAEPKSSGEAVPSVESAPPTLNPPTLDPPTLPIESPDKAASGQSYYYIPPPSQRVSPRVDSNAFLVRGVHSNQGK